MVAYQSSAKTEVKKMVYADPNMAPKDIHAILAKRGFTTTLSSVATHRSDFLSSIAVLRELGALVDGVMPPAAAKKAAAPKAAKKAKKEAAPKAVKPRKAKASPETVEASASGDMTSDADAPVMETEE
jgi:hypothetical protein